MGQGAGHDHQRARTDTRRCDQQIPGSASLNPWWLGSSRGFGSAGAVTFQRIRLVQSVTRRPRDCPERAASAARSRSPSSYARRSFADSVLVAISAVSRSNRTRRPRTLCPAVPAETNDSHVCAGQGFAGQPPGAVCAGSNPAGGRSKLFFEYLLVYSVPMALLELATSTEHLPGVYDWRQ